MAGAGEKHGRLAELLDAMADQVHHEDPQRLPSVLVADRRGVEVVIGKAGQPGTRLELVPGPVLGDGRDGRVVVAAQLRVLAPLRPVRAAEPLAPAPLDIELVDERRAQITACHRVRGGEGVVVELGGGAKDRVAHPVQVVEEGRRF